MAGPGGAASQRGGGVSITGVRVTGARQGPDGGRCPPGRWDGRRGAGGGDLSDSLRPSRLDSKPRTSVGGLDLLMLPMGRPPRPGGRCLQVEATATSAEARAGSGWLGTLNWPARAWLRTRGPCSQPGPHAGAPQGSGPGERGAVTDSLGPHRPSWREVTVGSGSCGLGSSPGPAVRPHPAL